MKGDGGKGEEREVVTNDFSWNDKTVRTGSQPDFNRSAGAAVRHQADRQRLKRGKSSGERTRIGSGPARVATVSGAKSTGTPSLRKRYGA